MPGRHSNINRVTYTHQCSENHGKSLYFCDLQKSLILSDPTHSIVVIWVTLFKTELMVGICSKSLDGAMGKVLLMEFSYNTN